VPPPQKKIEFSPVGILVHSEMTFYVYAKIGQVNGAPGSATVIFQKWLKIDGYMLRDV